MTRPNFSTGSNFPNGVYVWQDTANTWPGARSVDNQHSYRRTNITGSLAVPRWGSRPGR